uniref:Uncharacterized protein n=1 Tax=Anguilla anguilla TaxID=7936 RepID=A0A0E9RX70_ANGAN
MEQTESIVLQFSVSLNFPVNYSVPCSDNIVLLQSSLLNDLYEIHMTNIE